MTTIRLALNELRRVTSGRLPPLATLALVLVPLIYGSMYLYANYDPYGRLDQIPAAVVVTDKGATMPDGKPLNAGNDVATELIGSHSFDWTRTNPQDAATGVRDGRYTFAVTLPEDFSAALTSSAQSQPRQGLIELTTNDANNYLASTIADKVVQNVRDAVAKKVGTQATDRLLLGFSSTHDQLTKAAGSAQQLATGANQARDGANQVADGVAKLNTGQQQLAQATQQLAQATTPMASGLNVAKDKTADLPAKTTDMAGAAQQIADGTSSASNAAANVATASKNLASDLSQARSSIQAQLQNKVSSADLNKVLATMDGLRTPIQQANTGIQGASGQLSDLSGVAEKLSTNTSQLADAAPGVSTAIGQAADVANQVNTGATQARDGAKTGADSTSQLVGATTQLRTANGQLATGATSLQQALGAGANGVPNPNAQGRQNTANTVNDPVAVRSIGDAKASTYGAGLAPFFLALAMWIGAFALFLLLKPLSTRALAARAAPWQVALGGWLPSAVLAVLQALALYLTVVFAVGVSPANPVGTFLFLVVVGLSFTALVHGLHAMFGTVGKFIVLVLLVLQLVSAGGTFPWQTLPGVLQPLHVLLPMGYGVDGLRHLFYGGTLSGLPGDLLALLVWGVIGLALSSVAGWRKRVWRADDLRPELTL